MDPNDPLIPMPWQMGQIRAYRAEQAKKAQEDVMRSQMLEMDFKKRQMDSQFIDMEFDINGRKVNPRKVAEFNPELANRIQQDMLDEYVRHQQVKKARDDAEMEQAMAKITSAQSKIREEQAKQSGIFGIGGPNQKVIDEQRRVIENQSQTYGIPLGSEPEEASPEPAAKTSDALPWLRSKLK